MNEIREWSTGKNYCHEKIKVHLSATMAIKTALRQVEWIAHGHLFLKLLLHCKHVILADNIVASNVFKSKENILFCVISCLRCIAPQASQRTPATCIAATTPELTVGNLNSVF